MAGGDPRAAVQLLLSSRPISWINTAYPFAAGYLAVTREVDLRLIVGTLFFLVPYNLAMYGVNDVFDYESDLRNPRKGGVEGVLLDPRLHRATLVGAVASCVPFVVALVAWGDPASWAVLAVSLFAVAAYSVPGLRTKEIPVVDSLTSSTHFVSPAVYGLVLAGAAWSPGLVCLLLGFFLWGMASHAFGAVQDVPADRQGGIASVATVLGAARTVRLALGLWAASGLLMLGATWPAPLAGLLAVPYLLNALPYRSVPDERAPESNVAWRRFLWLNAVTGFAVTMLLLWAARLH